MWFSTKLIKNRWKRKQLALKYIARLKHVEQTPAFACMHVDIVEKESSYRWVVPLCVRLCCKGESFLFRFQIALPSITNIIFTLSQQFTWYSVLLILCAWDCDCACACAYTYIVYIYIYMRIMCIPNCMPFSLVWLLDIVGNALRCVVFGIITSVSENHIVLPKGILFYEIIKAIIMRYGVVRFCLDTNSIWVWL